MAEPVPMGMNPVGQLMAEKFRDRADGRLASFVGVIEEYREALTQARDAIRLSMRDYHKHEDELAEVIRDAMR